MRASRGEKPEPTKSSWEAADVVVVVMHTYERLPEDIQEKLPLRRVWMLSNAGLQ